MELTKLQKEGLEIAILRYLRKYPYTCISGYAGTGKSTLIKFIVKALQLKESEVAYISLTGKAAEVLRQRGCPNACTAHKLLYYSTKTINGSFIFNPRPQLEENYKLIVCDEVSMLPKDLWDLLLSHKVHVIACGDPFQIPPINKNQDNHVLDNPHIFLTEIMRQSENNDIINLSMKIRNNENISKEKKEDVQVYGKKELTTGMLSWADQIIVGTNKKKNTINYTVRQMKGLEGASPQVGDKVISIENHWDISDKTGTSALINGTIGYITKIRAVQSRYRTPSGMSFGPFPFYEISIETETGEIFEDLIIDKKYIETGNKTLSNKQEYYLYKNKNKIINKLPCLFEFGYAITGHRAQGSEWSKVLVIEEKFPFDKEEHDRWLYTCCTRPSSKLVLIRRE